ncbi:hypothetical protein FZEAL_6034 [Fusarium zealandicum]|uniref:Tafazzin n=1 Tax=Fusarium zealandicum TaxID=1053134 RepID=A0A8H4UIJ5_9HYPO|nr:hypothetical protein FZEAL_6034 [Fusarium zealandicum]
MTSIAPLFAWKFCSDSHRPTAKRRNPSAPTNVILKRRHRLQDDEFMLTSILEVPILKCMQVSEGQASFDVRYPCNISRIAMALECVFQEPVSNHAAAEEGRGAVLNAGAGEYAQRHAHTHIITIRRCELFKMAEGVANMSRRCISDHLEMLAMHKYLDVAPRPGFLSSPLVSLPSHSPQLSPITTRAGFFPGMPKKRNHVKSFKPSSTASPTAASTSSSSDKPSRSVNELLANLRRTSINPSAAGASQSALPATAPSVPPAIREILQIPDTPAPAPRRVVRQRFDGHGRRLPAGPPPPRSWVTRRSADAHAEAFASSSSRLSPRGLEDTWLPGTYLPARGSLIDIVLQKLAYDWNFHRVYNQYHLYFVPNHLKPALIRYVGIAGQDGLSLSDLKVILLPPSDTFDADDVVNLTASNLEVNYLDFSGSVGRSIRLKDIGDLLFPAREEGPALEPQESWDAAETIPSPSRTLLPNLTHLSLALHPHHASSASWRQLINLSSKLTTVTHLSLAYWPEPCFTPRARLSTVDSPQGNRIPYGGTNVYSHSLDHDWSEALLVLRMLSKNLYALEFLDLTGCSAWFEALMTDAGHDFVNWADTWGKITELRLYTGWTPGQNALPSVQTSYREAIEKAKGVEKHIRTMRAGKGRFIVVERDSLDT